MSQQGKFKKPKDLGNQTNYSPAPPDLGEELLFREGEARNRMPSESNSPWKGIVVNIIVALVIVFLMNSFVMPTVGKKAYISDITRLENDLVAIRDVVASQNSRIDAAVSNAKKAADTSIATATTDIDKKVASIDPSLYATANNLNDKVSKLETSIANTENRLISRMDQLNSKDLTNIDTAIANVNTAIADLDAKLSKRIEEVETQLVPSGDTITTGKVTASISWDNDDWYLASDNKTVVAQFKIKLLNGTNEDLEDIEFDIDFNWNGYAAGKGWTTQLTIEDKVYTSPYYGGSFDNVKLRNINVDANDDKRIYCNLYMLFTEDIGGVITTMDIDFDPEIDVVDYELD